MKVAVKVFYFNIEQDIESNKTLHDKTDMIEPLTG
jgi:hypothetical protein